MYLPASRSYAAACKGAILSNRPVASGPVNGEPVIPLIWVVSIYPVSGYAWIAPVSVGEEVIEVVMGSHSVNRCTSRIQQRNTARLTLAACGSEGVLHSEGNFALLEGLREIGHSTRGCSSVSKLQIAVFNGCTAPPASAGCEVVKEGKNSGAVAPASRTGIAVVQVELSGAIRRNKGNLNPDVGPAGILKALNPVGQLKLIAAVEVGEPDVAEVPIHAPEIAYVQRNLVVCEILGDRVGDGHLPAVLPAAEPPVEPLPVEPEENRGVLRRCAILQLNSAPCIHLLPRAVHLLIGVYSYHRRKVHCKYNARPADISRGVSGVDY